MPKKPKPGIKSRQVSRPPPVDTPARQGKQNAPDETGASQDPKCLGVWTEAKRVAEATNCEGVLEQLGAMKVPLVTADAETKQIFIETVEALKDAAS